MRLKTQVRLEVLRNLTNKTLERELKAQEIGGFLVLPYVPQRYGSRPSKSNIHHHPHHNHIDKLKSHLKR
jgi:hypothetical protein